MVNLDAEAVTLSNAAYVTIPFHEAHWTRNLVHIEIFAPTSRTYAA